MLTRPTLAVARAHALRPALTLPSLRYPSLRQLVVAAGLVAGVALAYAAARQTSLFAVRALDVSGAPPAVTAEVGAELEPLLGTSLAAADGDALERRLEAIPSVRRASVDRAFPHALAVTVRPERALAVVRLGPKAWLVSDRGRVIRPVAAGGHRRLPRVWLPATGTLRPGDVLADKRATRPLAALAELPRPFAVRVVTARAGDDGVTLVLPGRAEVRVGSDAALGVKLRVADAVLRALSPDERARLAYVDVTLPARPVATENSQVEG